MHPSILAQCRLLCIHLGFGLVTKSARQNQILDEYIANGIEPRYLDAMDMFVPIKAYEKKEIPQIPKKLNFFEKTLQFIDKMFEMI